MPRALPRYEIHFKKGREKAWFNSALTQVRQAIRVGRKALRAMPAGTQLTVRGWQPGDHPQWRGRVEYQAHLSADGKIIVAEER